MSKAAAKVAMAETALKKPWPIGYPPLLFLFITLFCFCCIIDISSPPLLVVVVLLLFSIDDVFLLFQSVWRGNNGNNGEEKVVCKSEKTEIDTLELLRFFKVQIQILDLLSMLISNNKLHVFFFLLLEINFTLYILCSSYQKLFH